MFVTRYYLSKYIQANITNTYKQILQENYLSLDMDVMDNKVIKIRDIMEASM